MLLLLFRNWIKGHFGKTPGNCYFMEILHYQCTSGIHDAIVCFVCFICSIFSDVFNEDHFINALANDVKVIKKLPKEMASAPKIVKHFRSWSGMGYYQGEIASLWDEYQVILAEMLHLLLLSGCEGITETNH